MFCVAITTVSSLLIAKTAETDLLQFAIVSPLAAHPSVISGCQCCICISMEIQAFHDETVSLVESLSFTGEFLAMPVDV